MHVLSWLRQRNFLHLNLARIAPLSSATSFLVATKELPSPYTRSDHCNILNMPPAKKRAVKAKTSAKKVSSPKKGASKGNKTLSTSPSGKSPATSKEPSPTTEIKEIVGIFFEETCEMTTFENTEDAQAFHLKLPRSARSKSKVVFFSSQEECNDYINSMSPEPKSTPPPVTPEKASVPRLKVQIKQENPYAKAPPASKSSSALLKKLQTLKQTYGCRMKLHVFHTTPAGAAAKVYMYEFQETRADFNHWCHKPHVWAYVFQSDEECQPHERQFDDWFHGQQACEVRDPRALMEEAPKKIVKRGKQGEYTITSFGLYGLVPSSSTQDDIIAMLKNAWIKVVESDEAQLCYHSMIESESDKVFQATKPLSMDAKSHYWNQVKGAIDNIVVESHHSLDEVFMKTQIDTILSSLFDLSGSDIANQHYSDNPQEQLGIRQFAFGR